MGSDHHPCINGLFQQLQDWQHEDGTSRPKISAALFNILFTETHTPRVICWKRTGLLYFCENFSRLQNCKWIGFCTDTPPPHSPSLPPYLDWSLLVVFFPGPPPTYIGSWTPSQRCPAPSLHLPWADTRLPRLLHKNEPHRWNTRCFRWPLVIWNWMQRKPSKLWAGLHETRCPGQPGLPGWFLRELSKAGYWEQTWLERGGKFPGWSGSSGASQWSERSQKEYPGACCESSGFPRWPGHVSISGRCCGTFGLHLPVQLSWLIWFIVDFTK